MGQGDSKLTKKVLQRRSQAKKKARAKKNAELKRKKRKAAKK